MQKGTTELGWPERREAVPLEIRAFYSYRDELTVQGEILFRGNRVIVPADMRSEMLKKIHASHIGIEGSLRQAREILYWPGMTTAIRDHVSACGTSIPFAWNNPKSPSCHRKYPTGPGQRLLWIYLHWIRPSISSSWMTTPISLSHEPCLIRELHQL